MFMDLKLKLRGMLLCVQEAGKSRAGEKKKKKEKNHLGIDAHSLLPACD